MSKTIFKSFSAIILSCLVAIVVVLNCGVQQAKADEISVFTPTDSSKLEVFKSELFNGLMNLETSIDVSDAQITASEVTWNGYSGETASRFLITQHPLFSTICTTGIPSFEYSGSIITKVNVTYIAYLWTEANVSKMMDAYNNFLGNAPANATEFQKAAYVHDWVCEHTSYGMSTSMADFAFGALVDGKAVCGGFAQEYQFLAQQLGLNCNYVSGTTKVEAHAWNKVKVDGQWFLVDTTWDRSLATESTFSHTYFMLNDKEFASAGDGSHDSDSNLEGNEPVNTEYYFSNKYWQGVSGPLSSALLAQDPKLTKTGSSPTPTPDPQPDATKHLTVYDGVDYSAVYDYEYYLQNNQDVAQAFGGDETKTLRHFVNYGMREGRVASTSFDVLSYYNEYADLRVAYGTNLARYFTHYLKYGISEGRNSTGCTELQDYRSSWSGIDYSPVYDGAYYFQNNSDLQKVFTKYFSDQGYIDDTALIRHFVNYGMREGRVASASFDVLSYYNEYADLRVAYGTNLARYFTHYLKYGISEGRNSTGCTELQDYRSLWSGTDYSPVFDGAYYFQNNSDLQKAFTKYFSDRSYIDDTALIKHFMNYGMKEKRTGNSTFDVNSYYLEYSDLRRAYGSNWAKYYTHYIRYGEAEGRNPNGCTSMQP